MEELNLQVPCLSSWNYNSETPAYLVIPTMIYMINMLSKLIPCMSNNSIDFSLKFRHIGFKKGNLLYLADGKSSRVDKISMNKVSLIVYPAKELAQHKADI